MSINTKNEKLAIIEYGDIFQPGIPQSTDGIGRNDKQQLLWGYPGILWGLIAHSGVERLRRTQQRYYVPSYRKDDKDIMEIMAIIVSTDLLN